MKFEKAYKVLNTYLFSSDKEREVAKKFLEKAWSHRPMEFDTKIRMLIDFSEIKRDDRVRKEDLHYFEYIEKLNKQL